MAREGKKLLHIHSNVPNKQPKPEFIEPGELAVNNAAGNEFISTKNSDGEVVRFSSDGKMVGIIENKEVMAYDGAVLEPTEEDLINNKSELLIKLNQMVAAQTPGSDDVNGARDMHGDEINPFDEDTKRGGAGFAINMNRYAMQGANPSFSSVTTDAIHANEGGDVVIDRQPTQTLSSTTYGGALEELATKIGEGVDGLFSSVEYISSGDTKEIIFKDRDGDVVGSVDATDFVIDGMVDNVSIEDVVIVEGEEPVKCMVITFNTDAGKQNINIPLTDIFDPSVLDNYYTKEEINNALGNLFTPSSVTSSVTEVIVENERVTSAALNDLDTRVRVLEALEDDVVVSGDVNSDSGIITLKTLEGNTPQVTGLSEYVDGRISSLSGDNYVTSGSVEGTSGIITLNRQNGDAQVTGLAEFVDGRVSSLSGDTYVTSGSVDENSGIITLNRQNGDAQVTGLAEYVNGKIGELSAIATDAEVVSESGDTKIIFKDKGGNEISGLTIDANEFVKDGMVTSVEIGIPESGSHAGVKCLIITWNDDSGIDPLVTEIPLTDIFDPAILDDYYTKAEINDALGDWFTPSSVTSSVTEVIIENEHVTSAALNDLNSRVLDLENATDNVVDGGSVDSDSGIITLNTTEGDVINVDGLADFINGKIAASSGDTYVTGGSINQSSGIITLSRQSGSTEISGLSEYVDSKIPSVSSDYLPLSGGTVTGDTTFDENVDVRGLLTTKSIEVDTGETIHASYTSGDVFPNDPRDDYDFVTGLDGRTVLSDFLLPSATTQDDGKVVMNVNGEWQAVEDRWLDWSGDTLDGDIIFADHIGGTDDYGIIYNTEYEVDIKVNGGMEAASGFTHMGITGSQGSRIDRNDYVLLGGGGYMAISAISPSVTDRWVDTSGDTMTGNLEFSNGGMTTLTINPSTGSISSGVGGGYSTNSGKILTNLGDISAPHGDVQGQTVTVSGQSQQAADAPKLMVYGDVEVYPSGTTSPMLLHITPDAGNGESILTVSGDITATGAMYSSDKRLKENIRFLSDEDIEDAKSVEFKAFNLISNKSAQKFGVIAQDLQDNGLGKLTGTNEAGFLTVDYISLLCLKIAQLEREIEELKKGK